MKRIDLVVRAEDFEDSGESDMVDRLPQNDGGRGLPRRAVGIWL